MMMNECHLADVTCKLYLHGDYLVFIAFGMQPPLRVSVEIKKEKQETFALYFFSMYYLCISSFCLDWDITYLRNKMV